MFGIVQHPNRHRRARRAGLDAGQFRGLGVERRDPGNPLLQQQQGCLEQRIGLEAPLHRAIQQQIGQRSQAHALVMGHVRAHQRLGLTASLAGRCVVDGLVKAILALRSDGGEPLQICAGRLRRHHQGQRGGIRRHDQVVGEAAFQSQSGHAKCPVLVIELCVHCVVAGFGYAPRHTALLSVFDLSRHCGLGGLVEQRVVVGRHDQLRHQVLEHRAAPRQENGFAGGAGEHPSQREPAVLRQLSLGDGDEYAESGFRSQQIVVTRVQPALIGVVADAQQTRCLVVQEAIIQLGKFFRSQGQILDRRDAYLGALARLCDLAAQLDQPCLLCRCWRWPWPVREAV